MLADPILIKQATGASESSPVASFLTMNYPDPKHIATFKQVISDYRWKCNRGDSWNQKMLAMFASDRKDMRRVLSLYKEGLWKEALDAVCSMDTAARDYIPKEIWNDINS